jgi:hypothetical protein
MRTLWASASVLALCVSPVLAQARDRGHDRRDDGGRRSSEGRQSERGNRGWNRERSDRGGQRGRGSGDRPTWTGRQRSDSGRNGGWRSSSSARSDRRDSGSRGSWTGGNLSNRGNSYSDRGRDSNRGSSYSDRGRDSNRGWSARDNRERWDRDRRSDSSYRGSYRSAPRRSWPSFRARPLRYPSGYRYGYFYRHGFYFPRYYYDYDSYSTHASVRILVEPAETEVYVDGYYAGVVDDFDGIFQRLHLTPGSHEITLRLDGYQTWSAEIFASPDSTVRLHHDMLPGPSGPEFDDSGVYEEPEPNQ